MAFTANNPVRTGRDHMESLRLKEAETCFRQALDSGVDVDQARIWMSRVALIQGRDAEGLDWLGLVEPASPNYAEALALRGICFLEKGDPDAALPWLKEAREKAPQLAMIYPNLARCHRELGELGPAVEAARRGVELNPDSFVAHYELADCLCLTGDLKEAVRECVESVRLNPLFLKGILALVRLFRLGSRWAEAEALIRDALKHFSRSVPLRVELCSILAAKKDFEAALVEAESITRLRSDYGDHLRVGTYALLLGRFERAEAAFREAGRLSPQAWEPPCNLGELYAAGNLREEARAQYEQSLAKGPGEWKPLNGLGLLLWNQFQDPVAARDYFVRGLEISPTQPELLLNLALVSSRLADWESAGKLCRTIEATAPAGHPCRQEAQRLLTALRREVPGR